MSDALGFAPDDLRGLFEVLAHPDHQRGLEEDRRFVVERLDTRAAALVRVTGVITGESDLDAWSIPNATVRLELPGTPSELDGIDGAPSTTSRVYTVAEIDPLTRRAAIDIVRHASPSPAMRWLDGVRPGDAVRLIGPRPHRVPGVGAPRILLADSSALPAALSILRLQRSSGSTVAIVAAPEDEIVLFRDEVGTRSADPERVEVIAVAPDAPTPLATFFSGFAVPAGASVWAAGEREDMRAVRQRCRTVLGLPSERAQIFGYWKRGVSNTRIDLARLQATRQALAEGRPFGDTDDFEIGV